MPTKDIIHDAVKEALIKDGWKVTDDPFYFRIAESSFYIDLGAEKLILAENEKERIAVEVKSFAGHSATNQFYQALGQYINYQIALNKHEPDRTLYLGVPTYIWNTFFTRPFTQMVIEKVKINIIVVDTNKTAIIRWIK